MVKEIVNNLFTYIKLVDDDKDTIYFEMKKGDLKGPITKFDIKRFFRCQNGDIEVGDMFSKFAKKVTSTTVDECIRVTEENKSCFSSAQALGLFEWKLQELKKHL